MTQIQPVVALGVTSLSEENGLHKCISFVNTRCLVHEAPGHEEIDEHRPWRRGGQTCLSTTSSAIVAVQAGSTAGEPLAAVSFAREEAEQSTLRHSVTTWPQHPFFAARQGVAQASHTALPVVTLALVPSAGPQ
jgi:hypothetical protein